MLCCLLSAVIILRRGFVGRREETRCKLADEFAAEPTSATRRAMVARATMISGVIVCKAIQDLGRKASKLVRGAVAAAALLTAAQQGIHGDRLGTRDDQHAARYD